MFLLMSDEVPLVEHFVVTDSAYEFIFLGADFEVLWEAWTQDYFLTIGTLLLIMNPLVILQCKPSPKSFITVIALV